MEYEIVNLEEKIVVGVSAKTSNNDENMGKIIGRLWEKLYMGGVYPTIKNKVNEYAIGLYCDYCDEGYTVIAGNEVSQADNSELVAYTIPKGKYGKVSVQGNMSKAVAQGWEEIWKMDLDRNCVADFEEYLNADMENARINIYIGLK